MPTGKGVPGKSCCRWGGFLSDVDRFDASFFGISPRDARRMDPQERLLLETAWHVLERAGIRRAACGMLHGRRVGVFVGSMSQQYRALESDPADRAALMLASQASLANRISHFFDFSGPSVAVDSMCSSGFEAIHLACQALRRGECQLAIAGAVEPHLHPDKYVALSEAGLIGSHRGSRAFAGGDGYLPAEGVGAVLLKPLAAARANRDIVLGVIKGSAVNHSGRSAGYGVPSAEAQPPAHRGQFPRDGIDPRTVGCIEAAASGSALGDAIELRAPDARVPQLHERMSGFCALGSVKANMGHARGCLGSCAGDENVCSSFRAARLRRSRIAEIDPDLEIEGSPFVMPRERAPWTRMAPDQPRRAAISSFGAGGTNVHLILEEAPQDMEPGDGATSTGPWSFVFSAASEDRLAAVVALDGPLISPQIRTWLSDGWHGRSMFAGKDWRARSRSWRPIGESFGDKLADWLGGPRECCAGI